MTRRSKTELDLNASEFLSLEGSKENGTIDAHLKVMSSRFPIGVATRYKPGFKAP